MRVGIRHSTPENHREVATLRQNGANHKGTTAACEVTAIFKIH